MSLLFPLYTIINEYLSFLVKHTPLQTRRFFSSELRHSSFYFLTAPTFFLFTDLLRFTSSSGFQQGFVILYEPWLI